MKFFLIAGEVSGDKHGGILIKAIKKDMSEPAFAKLFKKIYKIPLDYKSFN